MKNVRNLILFSAVSMGAACGSTPVDSAGENAVINVTPQERAKIDPVPGCNAAFCGNERFRAAIPTRSTIGIRFGDQSSSALAELSEAYQLVGEHVDEINDTVDEVFGAIEQIASTEPELAEDDIHVWRGQIDDIEVVLQITTEDDESFEFSLDAGDPGLELDPTSLGIDGTVLLDASGNKQSFEFTISFDELGYTADDDTSGDFVVSATPYAAGVWQVMYDISIEDGVSALDETTTYWVLGENDGAIEYSFDEDDLEGGESGEIFVRWDETGGRYDAFVQGVEDEIGEFDLVQTECWDGIGGLTFSGEALFSEVESYSEIEGDESACAWEFETAHPDPDAELFSYFDDESWEDYDDLPGAVAPPENNVSPPDTDCIDDAAFMNDVLYDCGYEAEDEDFLCQDPGAVAACVDELSFSDDPCATLDSPVCY